MVATYRAPLEERQHSRALLQRSYMYRYQGTFKRDREEICSKYFETSTQLAGVGPTNCSTCACPKCIRQHVTGYTNKDGPCYEGKQQLEMEKMLENVQAARDSATAAPGHREPECHNCESACRRRQSAIDTMRSMIEDGSDDQDNFEISIIVANGRFDGNFPPTKG
jgi:hypothetical protein